MTTVATVAGHFPLTLVTGAGAAARNSIGIVLVGGMTIGTFFTLFVVPSVYVLIAKDHSGENAPLVKKNPIFHRDERRYQPTASGATPWRQTSFNRARRSLSGR